VQIFTFKIPKINLIYSSDEDKIYVFDVVDGKNSKRYLTFSPEFHLASKQGTIYTKQKDKIASIYAKIMLCGFALKPKPEKVLIVGMGIGVIPREIAEFFPSIKMDVVEISSKVRDVAIDYFDFQKTDNMNIFIQDGYDFILNSTKNMI
jgi:spermidine synthase